VPTVLGQGFRFSAICATVTPRASWMKNVVPGVVGVSSAKAKLDDAAAAHDRRVRTRAHRWAAPGGGQ
jgi:hypothetical protein